jgi:hypothetical protein
MAEVKPKRSKANFLIGPPVGPDDMKALYQKAGEQAAVGDDSLAKRLFAVRQDYVKSIATASGAEKSMLQRIVEEKLGKEVGKLEALVAHSVLRGDMVPCLTVNLQTSVYPNGSPIADDLSDAVAKGIAAALAFVCKAQWTQANVT